MMYIKFSTRIGKLLHVYYHMRAVSCVSLLQRLSGCAVAYNKFSTSLGKILHVHFYMHVTIDGVADTYRAHNYVEITVVAMLYSNMAQPEGAPNRFTPRTCGLS